MRVPQRTWPALFGGTTGLHLHRGQPHSNAVLRRDGPSVFPRGLRHSALSDAPRSTIAALLGAGLSLLAVFPSPVRAETSAPVVTVSQPPARQVSERSERLTFERYHSQAEINAYLRQAAKRYPELVGFRQLGASKQGREISVIAIGRGDRQAHPAIYFNGAHHGDEIATPEAVLALAEHLLQHQLDPEISALLDRYTIYLQPLVNPDGHAAETREDSEHQDPNREYPYPRLWIRSSIPEIELVKDLLSEISPKGAVTFHSGAESVLWPWGYKGEAPPDPNLEAVGRATAKAMGFDAMQAEDDYVARGDFADYAYWRHGAIALTFEINNWQHMPVDLLKETVETTVRGSLAFIHALDELPDDLPGNLLTRTVLW